MQSLDNNTRAFFELVRAGLWEQEVHLLPYDMMDYQKVKRLADEQRVVGLVTAGLEHVHDIKVPQEVLLQFIGQTIQLEHQNRAMNQFIADLMEELYKGRIYTLLVKGQGIAQCYERPLWRASGDVDFLLSSENYKRATDFLLPISSRSKVEGKYSKHLGLTIGEWYIELHGTLRSCLSTRIDKEIDSVQSEVFNGGNVRLWMNEKTKVLLPGVDCDIFFVFTHFIKHFYKEGMTLRQICDWCRLMWTYKAGIDSNLLEKRLCKSNLMTEWRAFAALAVEHLGMPIGAMPLYDDGKIWSEKGDKIIRFILNGYSGSKIKDTYSIMKIFPGKTFQYLPSIFLNVNWLKIRERVFGQ